MLLNNIQEFFIFKTIPPKIKPQEPDSYYHISMHYKFVFQNIFDKLMYDAVIILEDDMNISPDFFSYFKKLYYLLKKDPTVFCISAWNDNGRVDYVKDPIALYRSEFFPGLGWMLLRSLWNELKVKWPAGFWDDWLREPEQRKGRVCIRPEVSRTFTFGKQGSSNGQFYDQYLKNIKLNDVNVDWDSQSLDYLQKEFFDQFFQNMIQNATKVNSKKEIDNILSSNNQEYLSFIIFYDNPNNFVEIANSFQIMNDFKSGIPRTSYKRTVWFYYQSKRIILAPKDIII
jgi:alpha-1,3-mannosyl-glycoprotein beta-1,2-N-acetylglucosaminyltransferase